MADKKKIIAGAGILGGIGLYYLLSRPRKPSPPTYTCPYCGETFGTYEELQDHLATAHPNNPPPSFGRITGQVLDSGTGKGIPDAKIYVDSREDGISDSNGSYQTNYYAFGTYMVTVGASNYQTANYEITIDSESVETDLQLTPVPASGGWSAGVTVRSVKVEPAILYLGQSVAITVYIDYPLPVPESVHATIVVDGEELSGDFPTTYARVAFNYTPTKVGDFTVVAKDKSANFTVLQDEVSTYYSPFGGTRMPVCTGIVVPDVEAFWSSGFTHPGGDLLLSGLSKFSTRRREVEAQLPNAYPVEWSPAGSSITQWVSHFDSGYRSSLIVMATEYNNCLQYWASKEELAKMISNVDAKYKIAIPSEWKVEYGTTCPTCGGTGQVEGSRRTMTCPTCRGTGIALRISLTAGLKNWVKSMEIGTNPPVYTGIKYYNFTIGCPYCGKLIELDHEQGRLALVRSLLKHIEEKHPSHLLTESAWF